MYVRYKNQKWSGWISEEFQQDFPGVSDFIANPEKIIKDSPCRTITRHEMPQGVVYAKLMRAQNDPAYQKREIWAWLKWAFGPSRSIHILKVSEQMLQAGFLCPQPLFAARKRMSNGWHQNLLITAEVTAPTLEQLLLTIGDAEVQQEFLRITARNLFAFHTANFVHGDFLPRNCCLDFPQRAFFFLDNDKTTYWSLLPAPWFLCKRNLEQFAYNLLRLQGFEELHDQWSLIFLQEYSRLSGRNLDGVFQNAMARWQGHHDHLQNK